MRTGYRILGSTTKPRNLVDLPTAYALYASCDPKALVEKEAFLSMFSFGEEFQRHVTMTGSTKKYDGPCWSPFVRWDVDREDDLELAVAETRKLALAVAERYQAADALLVHFSGSKGFHLELLTSLWQPKPSLNFNRVARCFADSMAERAGVTIDRSVYDKVRAFRAPNSWHPKTGLHKVALSLDELNLPMAEIKRLAARPRLFVVPTVDRHCEQAASDWEAAVSEVHRQAEAMKMRPKSKATLNCSTLQFITSGAAKGDRHRLLFSAAANLAEFGCPPDLAHALLTEAALDSGLSPSETRRQIECGSTHGVQNEEV